MLEVNVIGAGLAGCEAAWQLAQRGIHVTLTEMKPKKMSRRSRSLSRGSSMAADIGA